MADYSKYYEARGIVTNILERDLIGPVEENEYFTDLPTQYYVMGKLYPQSESDEVLDLARNPFLENAVESYDATVSLSHQRNPSSMGITCTLKDGVSSIKVSGSYAFYTSVPFHDASANGIDISRWEEAGQKPNRFWKRSPVSFEEEFIFTEEAVLPPINLEHGLQLQAYTHHIYGNGERIITVVLINTNQSGDDPVVISGLCAFQAEMVISSSEGDAIFADSNRQTDITKDPELLELEMLYADVRCYAQGHGCSVTWDSETAEPKWIASAWMPVYQLRQMMAKQIDDTQILNMRFLFSATDKEIIGGLRRFINSYGEWIRTLSDLQRSLPERFQETATVNIGRCEAAYQRINHSINLLEAGPESSRAMRAFRLANEAMFLQRKQTLKKNHKDVSEEKINWYPFQLAFVLHEISSFIEPESRERSVVDLLWFPTGGGKTEAYLGITAFAIFLRRLRNRNADGVTVLMRYTLRLLTLQQFERASMLIIACEMLRIKYGLGGREISIGLWVGGKLTPNSLREARSSINKLKRGAEIGADSANPCQVQICPWCGHRITCHDYDVDETAGRMNINCPNTECECHSFENGLPLHIIDDAIYRQLPSFIVATVDKFAQIPLDARPASLFGISNGKQPPELIIQDELHLISGPLGTMTGIYEAAVTKLCERNGSGAKIIASTATIRNAGNQILELYGRDYMQFPSQGLSARDSYFAVQSTGKERPERTYVGVMGVGTTATTTLIRINAALLFATRYLEALHFDDHVIDNFWTLTGYFNSLRELGGASTQILDDVQSRFSYLAKTKFASLTPSVDTSDKYDHLVELTSRMNNTDITKVIQDRLKREYREGNHSDVYDFVLASNMISVGVDVGRLGVMVVAGQPKTNAEYIQATSRVGRDNPGLVVTSYAASRSRDRSHYEQFMKYHSALFRYVEATSLTPFADRARDRGLHALYVSLCRYLVPGLLENNSAESYRSDAPDVRKIEETILDYVQKVDPDEYDAVEDELRDIEEEWEYETTGSLVYRSFGSEKKLLRGDTENHRFRTMNSMRNVDAQAGVYLLGR